jgi:hypothetical protein
MTERVYCEYDTAYALDPEGYVLAFCEESDIEVGCGWGTRAVNNTPKQANGIPYALFRQMQELDALHRMAWRTKEEVDKIHAFAEETRKIFADE